jgi:hypothetical protein
MANAWDQHQRQAAWDRQWSELTSELKKRWDPTTYESRGYYARKVLDQVPPALLMQLAKLPIATQVAIAEGFARSGSGVGLPPNEAILAAEMISDPGSFYRQPRSNDAKAQELHELARGLVEDFYGSMPDGHQPADQSESPGSAASSQSPAEGEARPAPAVEAEKLMRSPAFWSKQNPEYQHTHEQVSRLLAEAYPEPGPSGPQGEGGAVHE